MTDNEIYDKAWVLDGPHAQTLQQVLRGEEEHQWGTPSKVMYRYKRTNEKNPIHDCYCWIYMGETHLYPNMGGLLELLDE